LSPLGGEPARFRITHGRGRAASEFDAKVTAFDVNARPQGSPRSCTGISVLAVDGDQVVIEALVPGNSFPAQVEFTVEDAVRGVVLDRVPLAVTPIVIEGTGRGDQSPDLAVLVSEGGVPSVQLLAAEENGMFVRLGAPVRLGDPSVPGERDPRALATADFDRD